MKKLVSIIILCLVCLGILEAQNVWKPISSNSPILGAASNGDLYAMGGYSGLLRSQDEGETWQVVLGYETGFSGYINQHCFAVSNEGRICVFNDNQQTVVYSDDNGDTWQQTTIMSSCAMNDIGGIYAVSNDIVVVWSLNGEMYYTLDGGMTWGFGGIEIDEYHQVGDLIVNEAGDVYASKWYYSGEDSGIFHSSLSDMQNWELVAFDGAAIHQMEFDPDGNIVAGALWGSLGGFQHEPGFYLIDGQTIAVSDNGIVYHLRYNYSDYTAVLNYSTDHGEHFFDIGEALPTDNPAPGGGSGASIFKGHDNHLYFHGNGQYYKSVRDADHIREDFPYDNTRWAIYYQNLYLDWTPYIQIGIKGDTVVDGTTYHKVIKCTSYGNVIDGDCFGGIRVEADGKWYFRLFSEENVPQYLYLDMEPNTERLIYDYSLSVCDGFEYEGQYWMSVFEIDEIEINGSMRRRLWFDGNCEEGDHTYDWNWIEGIGSNFGLLYSIQAFPWDGSAYHLGEVYQDGELIYRDPYFINEPSSFAPQGAEWYFDVFNPWGTHPEYQRFFVDGDTIIQGHQCSIINQNFVDTGHEGGEFVYEEDNKVYWFNPTTNAFSILYDFDAEAGESWYYEVGECSHQVTVDSVGSVTWNGHNYRTQWVRFNEDVQYYSGKIIEGIGYEKGLFPSIYVCDGLEMFDASEIEYLRCYVKDGEMLYHEGGYDCDETTITPPSHPEWYYEILNENGTITYQYMYQAGDTIINDEPTHILVKINTLYDKGLREEVTHEYVFELNGKLYWWNKRLGLFTVLYDYEAEVGDSWNIFVGTEILTMHVDAVEEIEYEGRIYRMLRVSDPEDLFSGDIVCGIGHLTSFFPERLMNTGDGLRVEGMRCYWNENELVFKYGDEDCDAIYSEVHGVEEDGPSMDSGNAFTVYPNPTNGVLTVHHSAFRIHHSAFQIANLMGQTVLAGNLTTETQQIDVSGLPQGMYFVTVGGETRKFVVK